MPTTPALDSEGIMTGDRVRSIVTTKMAETPPALTEAQVNTLVVTKFNEVHPAGVHLTVEQVNTLITAAINAMPPAGGGGTIPMCWFTKSSTCINNFTEIDSDGFVRWQPRAVAWQNTEATDDASNWIMLPENLYVRNKVVPPLKGLYEYEVFLDGSDNPDFTNKDTRRVLIADESMDMQFTPGAPFYWNPKGPFYAKGYYVHGQGDYSREYGFFVRVGQDLQNLRPTTFAFSLRYVGPMSLVENWQTPHSIKRRGSD